MTWPPRACASCTGPGCVSWRGPCVHGLQEPGRANRGLCTRGGAGCALQAVPRYAWLLLVASPGVTACAGNVVSQPWPGMHCVVSSDTCRFLLHMLFDLRPNMCRCTGYVQCMLPDCAVHRLCAAHCPACKRHLLPMRKCESTTCSSACHSMCRVRMRAVKLGCRPYACLRAPYSTHQPQPSAKAEDLY